jgi:16S rRNA (cytosine967-C5)-methyltransferase
MPKVIGPRLHAIAANVIRNATRERPADAVLRDMLRADPTLAKGDRRIISRAVFAYYRWKQLLPREAPIQGRLAVALDWQERFTRNPFSVPVELLARKAVPRWVEEQLTFRPEWLRWLQHEPRLWLRVRPGQAKALEAKLHDTKRSRLPMLRDAVEYTGRKDLFAHDGFVAGDFELQDIASQAVSVLCAPKPGESWWDVCAGEGGKALHLADLMENKGSILATDRAGWRLQRLITRAARAKVTICRTQEWDATADLDGPADFDGALVDAPCSGLGTWQRNPHARWTTSRHDVVELVPVQQNLLVRAAAKIKPGGRLVYAVCTLTRDETTGVSDHFDRSVAGFEPVPFGNPFNELIPAAPRMLLAPNETGGNGMFVAMWRRL